MSVFKVDYSKAAEFQEIEPGEYEAIVHSYEMKQSSSKKNMVVVDYEIRDDVDQPCGGMKVRFDNFVVSENTEWRFQALSKAVGVPEGTPFSSYKEWADTIINQPVLLIVGTREHNGRKYAQVKGFKPSNVAPPEDDISIGEDETPF
ncbi:DUF669 domain-containing protein [Shouchella clausii]|uniref:DUF669 domain-containing protein n=1 Tax=Shouchella clausii TaxID=79880 RepID=UPI00289C1BCE|nr:DUF669 domain-containing protein [Shouchella clausii]